MFLSMAIPVEQLQVLHLVAATQRSPHPVMDLPFFVLL
jgi:hypothetical protein